MDNLNQNMRPETVPHRGVINGQEGTWVPVDASNAPGTVSNDINRPSQAQDGNFYYQAGGMYQGGSQQSGFAPIAANQYNAIPTPSSIVQLPPIVQPIALVPYASQNQPLVQYDANYREEITKTNLEPVYRAKPYVGLSVLCILFSVIACVILCLIGSIKAGASATGLDAIFGLLVLFGIGTFTSSYYNNVLSALFADGVSAGFSANAGGAIMSLLIPIFYVVCLVLAIIAIIYYLVKLGKSKSPRGFNIVSLLGLIISVVNIILMLIAKNINPDIGAYIIAGLFLALLIVPFFARKGAQVIDYGASKRLYGGHGM